MSAKLDSTRGISVGRPRLYKDDQTRWRKNKRDYRKKHTPYYLKQAATRQALDDVRARAQKALDGVFDVIVVDPPWPAEVRRRKLYPNQVALPYPTMTLDAIKALTLPMAETCHVWLWTTQRFLLAAGQCLAAWGLDYKCCITWCKPGGMQPMELPQFTSEFALYARKGSARFVDTTELSTWFQAQRTGHSAKPDEFYAMVRRVTAGRRLDMFARRQIEGFESWGAEAPGAA
jgi:N6-adenosine-specific RNA methylase IME4